MTCRTASRSLRLAACALAGSELVVPLNLRICKLACLLRASSGLITPARARRTVLAIIAITDTQH